MVDWKPDGIFGLIVKDAMCFYASRFPGKSDREIAEISETSHTTVGRYRKNEVKE
jgi:hypothetical protein